MAVPLRSQAELQRVFEPILRAVERQSGVAGTFVDKDLYCIYLATLWANVVMDPAAIGLAEDDLEGAHDVINLNAARLLGDAEAGAITRAFEFVNGPDGEQAMEKAKVPKAHRDLLRYFSSMILDPERHRAAMAGYRNQSDSQGT